MIKKGITVLLVILMMITALSTVSAAEKEESSILIGGGVTPRLAYYRVFDHYEGNHTVTDYDKYYMGSVMMSNYSYTTTGYLYYEQAVAVTFTHTLNGTVSGSATFKAAVAQVALSGLVGGAYSRSYSVNYSFGGGVDVEPRTRQILKAYNPGAHIRGIKVYEIVDIDGSHLAWEEENYDGNWYPTTTPNLVILEPTPL